MYSEWLKVMLEEIARKREEAERARRESELRRTERAGTTASATARSGGAPQGRRKTS